VAAPTLVSVGDYLSEGSGSTAVIDAPEGVQADDIVLIFQYSEHEGAAIDPTSTPSGFTLISEEHTTTDISHTRVYWKRSTGSEPSSYTFTFANSNWRTGFAIAIRGCTTEGSPIDVVDSNSISSSVSTTPAVSLTTTGPDRLVIFHGSAYHTRDWTGPSGYTVIPTVGVSGATILRSAWQVMSSAGSTGNVTATAQDGTDVMTAHLIALKPQEEVQLDPPGSVFDLTNWKVTLPTEDPEDPGDADEVTQPELGTYADQHFYLDDQDRMVMIAPTSGDVETTGGSSATRCELREMVNDGVDEAAWSLYDTQARSLTVTGIFDPTSITGGSTPRQEMIIGQIHGPLGNPPLYLACEHHVATPRIRIFKYNGSSSPGVDNMLAGITPSSEITYRIEYDPGNNPAGGTGTVKVYGAFGGPENLDLQNPNFTFTVADFFGQDTGLYFKAGAYNKTTVSSGSSGAATATISALTLEVGDEEPAVTGALAASLPMPGASLAADVLAPGALAGSLPLPTVQLDGDAVATGALAGTLPLPTATLGSTGEAVGELAGLLPLPTAQLDGDVVATGVLAGTLPLPTADLGAEGDDALLGELSATLPLPGATLAADVTIGGALVGPLPLPHGALAASVADAGELGATLPLPVAALIADTPPTTGGLAAVLPLPTTQLGGDVVATGALAGTLSLPMAALYDVLPAPDVTLRAGKPTPLYGLVADAPSEGGLVAGEIAVS
jgi:hypothetical protein